MLKSRLLSILTVIAIAIGGLVATSAPASAASNDATLVSLSAWTGVNAQDGGLRPGFDAAQTWYQLVATNDTIVFRAVAADAGATIHFKWNGHDDVYNSGDDKLIIFPVAVTKVSIEVTASDGVTKRLTTFRSATVFWLFHLSFRSHLKRSQLRVEPAWSSRFKTA